MSGRQGNVLLAPQRQARRPERSPITPQVAQDWKVQCFQALGWQSKSESLNTMFAEMTDVAERTLQGGMRGSGPHSANATEPLLKGSGDHFRTYHALRKDFEQAHPRTQEMVTDLQQAAQNYIDHFDKDYSKREKTDEKNIAKKAACQATIMELRRFEVALKIGDIEAPPWDNETTQQAAALKTELVF